MARRLAVVIGNANFEDAQAFPALRTPVNDARDFAEVLKKFGGFEVFDLLLNETADRIGRAIENLYSTAERGDLTLLYYSGHGYRSASGRFYLAVRNTSLNLLRTTAIWEEFLRDAMMECRARHRVLILDCCYSGAIIQGTKESVAAPVSFESLKGQASAVLASSGRVQQSFEEQERNSLFTQFLLEGIKTGQADQDLDGEIEVRELFEYARQGVLGVRTNQSPMLDMMEQETKLLIARNPNPPMALLGERLLKALDVDMLPEARRVAVEKLAELLQGSDARLAQAARRKLEELCGDDSRIVSEAARRALVLASQVSREGPDKLALTLAPGVEMVFVQVPAGVFLMGSKNENPMALDPEKPQHMVKIPAEFWIARYPVTNAQFAAFVQATHYRTTAEEQDSSDAYDGKKRKNTQGADWQHPRGPRSSLKGKENHPVVMVSWLDALVYCRWLDETYHSELPEGCQLRLPTEAEWEKAARGENGNEWPWGNNEPDETLCNFAENVKDTTQVEQYSPQGDSPYGCADMAGNVWEWTHSLSIEYPYKADDGREDEESSGERVVRGGSFDSDLRSVRCACRAYGVSDVRDHDLGFRVVASPIRF